MTAYSTHVFALPNVTIPAVGIRVIEFHPTEITNSLKESVQKGIRFFDFASGHQNEKAYGAAIEQAMSDCRLEREDLFISTNMFITRASASDVRTKLVETLKNLNLKSLDMVAIHLPIRRNAEMKNPDAILSTFKSLLKEKLVKCFSVTGWYDTYLGFMYSTRPAPVGVSGVLLHSYIEVTNNWTLEYTRELREGDAESDEVPPLPAIYVHESEGSPDPNLRPVDEFYWAIVSIRSCLKHSFTSQETSKYTIGKFDIVNKVFNQEQFDLLDNELTQNDLAEYQLAWIDRGGDENAELLPAHEGQNVAPNKEPFFTRTKLIVLLGIIFVGGVIGGYIFS